MPEEIKTPAAGEGADKQPDAGENGQAGANDKPAQTDAGKKDAGKGEEQGGGGADGSNKDPKEAKAPTVDSAKDDVDDLKEPVTRQRLSKQDFIIGRQRRKLAKEHAKQDDGQGNDKPDDDDEIPAETEDVINKVVSKNLAPLIEKSIAPLIEKSVVAEDDKEIRDFLAENPDFKPFEAKARRYMQHPSRSQLPVKSIFYEVAGDKLIKIGAERERAAAKKANETQTGGGSNRANETAKSDFDLSKQEFEAKQERIRRGQSA